MRNKVRHTDGLVGATVVIESDPFSNDMRGLLLGLEAMKMIAFLRLTSDDVVADTVRLRSVRRG